MQYWISGSIFVSRSNRILDQNFERYWQTCQRSHADPRSSEIFGETLCKNPVTKLFTRLLRHRRKVYREADGAVCYDHALRISTKNSRTGPKWNKLVHWHQLNWWHEIQTDKHHNMLNDVKHVEHHEHIIWRLVNTVDWTTAELVCFVVCLVLVVSVVLICCTVLCQDECTLRWLNVICRASFLFLSTSPPPPLFFSSSPPPLFFPPIRSVSPHFRLFFSPHLVSRYQA